jgi:hypothetical protein
MRSVYAFVGIVAVIAWGVVALTAQPALAIEPVRLTASDQPMVPEPAQPTTVADSSDPGMTADDACSGGCGCRCRQCWYDKLLNKWADPGYSNCSCKGSYKFPVPPQYTYFWPGMYSQQTMTEYNSPYRFPNLKNPPTDKAEAPYNQDVEPMTRQAPVQVRQVSQSGSAAPQLLPSDHRSSESISAKIKRSYGID